MIFDVIFGLLKVFFLLFFHAEQRLVKSADPMHAPNTERNHLLEFSQVRIFVCLALVGRRAGQVVEKVSG